MPIVWTDAFPSRERPAGYARLLLARYRYFNRLALRREGLKFSVAPVPGYKQIFRSWKNKYRGRRCFVLGNGPSLKKLPMERLRGEITIGVNGVYKNFPEWGFPTTYTIFEDIEQTEIRRREIPEIKGTTKLAAIHNAYAFRADDSTFFMNCRNLDEDFLAEEFPKFSTDFPHLVHLASTVTFISLQLAYHLGCDPVYLIGVDHDYGQLPKLFPPCKITITPENIGLVRGLHLRDDYYKIGDVIGVPPVDYMEAGYAEALRVFESRGRKIFNAGLDSKLEVFPRVSFDSIFNPAAAPAPSVASAPAAPSRPRVLFISHDAGALGAQLLLLQLLRVLKSGGQHEIRTLVREPNGTLLPAFSEIGPAQVFYEKAISLGPAQERLRDEIRAWNPALIYTNTAMNGDVLRFLNLPSPVVAHIHELEWYLKTLDAPRSEELGKAAAYIAVSEAVKRNLAANHGIPAEKISVVNGAVELAALNSRDWSGARAAARRELAIPEDAIVVGNVGRIDDRKGWDLFLDAAKRALAQSSRARDLYFLWIGHGPNRDSLLAAAREAGLADRILAPGTREDPHPFFEAMDIFLTSSRDDPFPIVMMEAAYHRLPVLCFAEAGGAAEFVAEGRGLAVPEMSAAAMAAALETLVADPALRARLGSAARAKVEREHDITFMAARIEAVLQSFLKSGGKPASPASNSSPTAAAPAPAAKPVPFGPTPPPAERALLFPSDASIGQLKTRPWESKAWDWEKLAPAKGRVQIPAARELMLVFDSAAAPRLAPLSALSAGDLQSIHLMGAALSDDDLAHLSGLRGLRTLDLRQTPLTEAGLGPLASLAELRSIYLPAQIGDAAMARLAAALPRCAVRREESAPGVSARVANAPPPERAIAFPSDRALGLLMYRGWNSGVWHWVEIGPARGPVVLPARREIMLVVYDAPDWLARLLDLPADAIHGVHLRQVPSADDAALHSLGRFGGLRSLDLRETRVTSAAITDLISAFPLLSLVYLPAGVSEEAAAKLSRALPRCAVRR